MFGRSVWWQKCERRQTEPCHPPDVVGALANSEREQIAVPWCIFNGSANRMLTELSTFGYVLLQGSHEGNCAKHGTLDTDHNCHTTHFLTLA
eukprot:IDg20131t1